MAQPGGLSLVGPLRTRHYARLTAGDTPAIPVDFGAASVTALGLFSRWRRPKVKHLIHLQSARQVVRNKHHRHLAFQLIDGLRKLFGGLLIQAAGGFIKDQHLRPLEQRPRNGNALLLPAG